jgi:hypothetical protein
MNCECGHQKKEHAGTLDCVCYHKLTDAELKKRTGKCKYANLCDCDRFKEVKKLRRGKK